MNAMEKLMTLEHLSSIKGAEASDAVSELFESIKKAADLSEDDLKNVSAGNAVSIDDLRKDEPMLSSEAERNLIKANFPNEKNGYLVVSKVIED